MQLPDLPGARVNVGEGKGGWVVAGGLKLNKSRSTYETEAQLYTPYVVHLLALNSLGPIADISVMVSP